MPAEQHPLVSDVSANFFDRGCHMVNVTDPYGCILGFLDRSHYFFFFFKKLLNCVHEAEWTRFQTHYFSENLVEPGIEPGPVARNSIH
jgi:hypothetical protein